MENILICDDDKEIVESIAIYLEEEGYLVFKAYDGIQGLELIKRAEIQLAIIDIMMPNMDGFRFVKELRKFSSIPIIFLSAKSEDADKILGLNIGADDYMTKPFNALELVARVKSNLRRYMTLGSKVENDNIYSTGGLVIDDNCKECYVLGESIKLTPVEYNILCLLVKNKGRVYSIEQIYEEIWEEAGGRSDNTIAVHIRHIREKIEINPKDPKYLKVVWGVGYKVEEDAC
ncbi:response regulator transcription factor [Butyrivibrio sp. YAB3001]|uniref:response regulator transcription factor n=1 Tax=Butyrivibrio sp. YAB3001 TaxID=1520812 RepID=UPI0008F67F16|nr:response regulator transcription factor [Butyrivibrio sp. YAB3001]SFB68552.1 DNA-binding response regulator, OmpR family, contains REC and winged-helix (wHTH) domain [Butyrivibrio sp. YAB3001]